MAQKTFFAVKDLDGDGKHYCAVAFESKSPFASLARDVQGLLRRVIKYDFQLFLQ